MEMIMLALICFLVTLNKCPIVSVFLPLGTHLNPLSPITITPLTYFTYGYVHHPVTGLYSYTYRQLTPQLPSNSLAHDSTFRFVTFFFSYYCLFIWWVAFGLVGIYKVTHTANRIGTDVIFKIKVNETTPTQSQGPLVSGDETTKITTTGKCRGIQ